MAALSAAGLAGALLVALGAGAPPPAPPAAPDGPAPSAADSGRADLDVQEDGSGLVFHARFVSETAAGPLRYTLEVTAEGQSRSTQRQSGRFTAAPGETAALSTSRVDVGPDSQVSAVLTVSDGDRVVAVAHFHSAVDR